LPAGDVSGAGDAETRMTLAAARHPVMHAESGLFDLTEIEFHRG